MNRYTITATLVLPALAFFVTAAWAGDGTWNTSKADMPTERSEAVTGVVNGKIYVMSGYNGGYVKENEVYDPAANSWDTSKTDVWTARRAPAVGAVNGTIYVIGGSNGTGYLNYNEAYDTTKNPPGDNWAIVAPMPTARRSAACATVNGKIYVIGGYNAGGLRANCEAYDPADGATGSWEALTPMPAAREAATASVVNGKIYVIGGHDGSSYTAKCEEYDPTTDTWTEKTPMSTAREYAASGAVNGMIYVVGGYSGVSPYPTINEEYNPASNSWTTRTAAPLPESRRAPTAGVVNGKLYVFGGDYGVGPYQKNCWEYSPPVTNIPPSITTQPVSVTVNVGETAEFTVAADGSPAPTYQWQKSTDGGGNWTDIAGATGTTYTTPATVPGDGGTRFRCVASNVAGDTFSQAAVLSIRKTFQIPLASGYNLIALPFEPETPYTASRVLAEINASGTIATRALRFNGTGYDVYTEGGGGMNFAIAVGMGFFVRCTGTGSWTVTAKE